MSTLYAGFIYGIQNTNMAEAATQLSLNQTALAGGAAGHVQSQPS